MKKTLIYILLPVIILLSGLCVCMAGLVFDGPSKDPIAGLMQRIKGVEPEETFPDDPDYPDDPYDPEETSVPEDSADSEPQSAETAVPGPEITTSPEPSAAEGTTAAPTDPQSTSSPSVTEAPGTNAKTTAPAPVTQTPPTTKTPVTTQTPVVTGPVPDYKDRDVNSPDYFKDALFVGDSRIYQLFQYAPIEGADCYGDTLMRITTLWDVREIDSLKNRKTDLDTYLRSHSYRIIYLMEGINELSAPVSRLQNHYKEVTDKILELQPSAVVVLVSIFHTSRWREKQADAITNKKINQFNDALKALADNDRIFYMDVSALYDDAGGYFSDTYTKDGVHPYAKYYPMLRDFILTKGKY